eukprot:scaffold3575_cov254-Pinguiococcus_pyrenoidosus.AAC.1
MAPPPFSDLSCHVLLFFFFLVSPFCMLPGAEPVFVGSILVFVTNRDAMIFSSYNEMGTESILRTAALLDSVCFGFGFGFGRFHSTRAVNELIYFSDFLYDSFEIAYRGGSRVSVGSS